MDKIFLADNLKNLLHFSSIHTDDAIFRLHYKYTSGLFLVSALLVTATQFFGSPILCSTFDLVPAKMMETFCWVEGTITLKRAMNNTLKHLPAPGVDQKRINDGDEVSEHVFYQWVSLFLLFEAAMFYFPRWLWRSWERGRMKSMVSVLQKPFLEAGAKDGAIKSIVEYFVNHQMELQTYAYRFFFCEILSLINVIGQIFMINRFLGGEFTRYGWSVLRFMNLDDEDRIDPMIEVFPKMTKCRFMRFGTSGEVQTHDSICLLSLNVINEKLFVIIWFWLFVLMIVTAVWLCYRTFFIGFKNKRYQMLSSFKAIVKRDNLVKLTSKSDDYGDWFTLYLLKNNMRALYFNDLVDELSKSIPEKKRRKEEKQPFISSHV